MLGAALRPHFLWCSCSAAAVLLRYSCSTVALVLLVVLLLVLIDGGIICRGWVYPKRYGQGEAHAPGGVKRVSEQIDTRPYSPGYARPLA